MPQVEMKPVPYSKRILGRREESPLGEISPTLRVRLRRVLGAYIKPNWENQFENFGAAVARISPIKHRLDESALDARIEWETGSIHKWTDIVEKGNAGDVLDLIDYFLESYRSQYPDQAKGAAATLDGVLRASGSAYRIDQSGRVNIRVTKDTLELVKRAEGAMPSDSRQEFTDALSALFSRSKAPRDIVKDVHVAFERYLKTISRKRNYSEAVKWLEQSSILSGVQLATLHRLHGYRSNAYGVAHASHESEPDEADALWFVETLSALIGLIAARV